MTSKISASFTLTGLDFEPEEITDKLGIQPTKTWRFGEQIHPKAKLTYKQNGWTIKSNSEKTADLEEHIRSIFEQLQPGWQTLLEICSRYHAEIACVIYVMGDERPAIHLDREMVRLAAKLNAEIDVDLYVLPEENEPESGS